MIIELFAGNRVHIRAVLLTSQSKCGCMFGAAWKIKLAMGAVIGMKTDQIKGLRVTSVRAKWKLCDGLKDVTVRLNNFKPGELMNLIDDGPQEYVQPEPEDNAQLNPTEDRVTPLEGALSPNKRLNNSNEMHSQDVLGEIHGRAYKREEGTMHLNGMISSLI